MRRLLSMCLALALLLCGCGKQEARGAVTLWCASDDPLLPALRQAAEDYARLKKDAMALSLREFESAEALQSALNTARPELLLCSHTLAFALSEEGLLGTASVSVRYPDSLAQRAEGIGSSVFPLGSRVQLLLTCETDTPRELFALCAWALAQQRPCLAADSYADLICQSMLGTGEFHADRGRDCFSPAFQRAWNALADCAFSGSLYTGAFLPGASDAAFVYADRLTGGVPAGFTLSAPEAAPRLADLRCLALTRPSRGASAFLSWLFDGERPGSLALESGLIPALPGGEAAGELPALLLSLRDEALWLPDGGSDFVKNRAAFEADFREAMDLLR